MNALHMQIKLLRTAVQHNLTDMKTNDRDLSKDHSSYIRLNWLAFRIMHRLQQCRMMWTGKLQMVANGAVIRIIFLSRLCIHLAQHKKFCRDLKKTTNFTHNSVVKTGGELRLDRWCFPLSLPTQHSTYMLPNISVWRLPLNTYWLCCHTLLNALMNLQCQQVPALLCSLLWQVKQHSADAHQSITLPEKLYRHKPVLFVKVGDKTRTSRQFQA